MSARTPVDAILLSHDEGHLRDALARARAGLLLVDAGDEAPMLARWVGALDLDGLQDELRGAVEPYLWCAGRLPTRARLVLLDAEPPEPVRRALGLRGRSGEVPAWAAAHRLEVVSVDYGTMPEGGEE